MKNNDYSRILIVNVNWIGDVLFSTPFIKAIRKAYPDSFIACMIPPRCRDVLSLNPNLDEVIIFDEEGEHSSIAGKIKFVSMLKKKQFSAAIFLHRSFTRTLIAYLAGIRIRVGYYTKKRAILLNKPIKAHSGQIHRADSFLNIARGIGIAVYGRGYEFFISTEDETYINRLLESHGIMRDDIVIVVNAGGNWGPKRWPKENFTQLIKKLTEGFKAKIIISGSDKDMVLAEEITSPIKDKDVFVLCGKTNLKQLAALFKRANLVISNDTGPVHIAAAMKAPTVALFGPTSPHLTGPCGSGKFSVIWKESECTVPCYDISCHDNRCMKLITVDDVMVEAKKLISNE